MQVEKVEPFFESRPDLTAKLSNARALVLDWTEVNSWDEEIGEELLNHPRSVLEAFQQGASHYNEKIHIHVKNAPFVLLRKIEAKHNFKLISVKGIVAQVSKTQSRAVKMIWQCRKCGAYIPIIYDEYQEENPPAKCFKEQGGCGKRTSFIKQVEMGKYINYKSLSVAERPSELPAGQIPSSIPVILLDDLVDGPRCGDLVLVTGIVRVRQACKKERTSYPVIEATHIEIENKEMSKIRMTEEEKAEIILLGQDPCIYERIIDSIAPSIYGHQNLKEGIMLALFGGVRKDKGDIVVRGDIHILFIGDPSTAKSQLLMFARRVALRGIYCSGKRASAAGLTASVIKTEAGWTLVAGALVLGDLGTVCIDELDKMDDEDRCAIHEAMEQQTISVNKAGINQTLNSRCTILAVCNPELGRYDKYKNVGEQINLGATLVSRFDLIFIVRDVPDVEMDEKTLEHMFSENNYSSHIPVNTLRKYIAFARRIKPKMGKEAYKYLKRYFLKARATVNVAENSPIQITLRQIEGVARLTEAVAKVHLRKETTVEDAEKAIKIWYASIKECGIDPTTGEIDIDIVMTGKPKSLRDNMSIILDIVSKDLGGMMLREDLVKEAEKQGVQDPLKIIFQLMKDGVLYERRQGFVAKR